MFAEERQFESKANAGPSKTFPEKAGTIMKNGEIQLSEFSTGDEFFVIDINEGNFGSQSGDTKDDDKNSAGDYNLANKGKKLVLSVMSAISAGIKLFGACNDGDSQSQYYVMQSGYSLVSYSSIPKILGRSRDTCDPGSSLL